MLAYLQKYFKLKSQELSLLKLFISVYKALTILGLSPYHIKLKSKHKCIIIPRTVYLNGLYAISLIILMSAFSGLHIQVMVNEVRNNEILTQVNYIIEVVILVASCIVGYISVYSYRHTIIYILNAMSSAWHNLPVTQNNILKKLRVQIVVPLVWLFVLLVLHVLINCTRNDGHWKKILVTFSFILPQMIQFVALTFYYVLILMLVALLTNVEEAIKSLGDKNSTVQRIRQFENRSQFYPTMLRTIELVYVKAFEIKEKINKTFQAIILLTSLQCFHAIVSEAHIIYHGVFVTNVLNRHQVINFSFWIVYQIMKVNALANTGNILNTVNIRIGRALHNIPPEKHDMRTLLEIQHFSSLMSYQSTGLTVYQYFPLDASFVFKILSSAAMYLIILVQFDKKN